MRSLLGPQDGGPSGPESVSPKTRCVILSQNCSFSESSGVRPLRTWLSSRAQSRQVLGCGSCWPWPAPSASKDSSPAGSLWVERVLGLCCNLALSIKSKMILFVTILFSSDPKQLLQTTQKSILAATFPLSQNNLRDGTQGRGQEEYCLPFALVLLDVNRKVCYPGRARRSRSRGVHTGDFTISKLSIKKLGSCFAPPPRPGNIP